MSQSSSFRRALQNVGWLLTGKGVGAVLSLVYLGLATRSLGLERFGQFTLILSAGQAVAGFVTFQSWQIVVRYGVALLGDGQQAALGRLIRFCALLDLGAALVGCVIAAIVIALLGPHLGWSGELREEAMLFCWVLLLSSRSTPVGILRLHDRFSIGAAADAVTPIARFAGAIVAVLSGATVSGFLMAWAIAEIVTALVYWTAAILTDRSVIGPLRGAVGVPREHAGFWHFAWTVNVNSTLDAGSKQLLIVLVGVIAGQAAAGAYRLAFQLSQALARLGDMFSRAIFPEFTRAHESGSADRLQKLFRQATRFTVTTGAAICVLAPILGHPILKLVGGSAFKGAYPILVLLSLATALDVMSVGFEPMLLGTGRSREIFRIRLTAVIALFAIAIVAMLQFGAIGAAVATLVSSMLALGGLVGSARRAVRGPLPATPI
nr:MULTISPECIES: oligosaccharide flippase family protein [unclassified Sphingomonas]